MGFYGWNCSKLCSKECAMGCQRYNAKCLGGCKTGWYGEKCDIQCPMYKYGANCIKSCGHCKMDVACNRTTGLCPNDCLPGWTGAKCDEVCPLYTYDDGCNNTCGHCADRRPCNAVTGRCSKGCQAGWTGEKCNQACSPGWYGPHCSLSCFHCAANASCDHSTGLCPGPCEPGWTGEICDENCPDGTFGFDCEEQCDSCSNMSCDSADGTCHDGCSIVGVKGRTCKQTCEQGRFGLNCLDVCGQCQNNTRCDAASGICVNGCSPGWHGDHCMKECEHGKFGSNCGYICGNCKNGTVCHKQTGVCPYGCNPGWNDETCTRAFSFTEGAVLSIWYTSPLVPSLGGAVAILIVALVATLIYFTLIRQRPSRSRRRHIRLSQGTPRSLHTTHIYEPLQRSPWELNSSDLLITGEQLGNGHFGEVRRGYVRRGRGQKVAVAVKSLKENSSEKDKQDFLNELAILKKVGKHTNVVCLVGACHIRGTMCVALEFARHGDLRTYIRRSRRQKNPMYENTTTCTSLKQSTLHRFALDCARGLAHLADAQIIHRDVAARNMLLGENLVVKVADFGLSKNDDTYTKTSNTRVPVRWMAMESLFLHTYTTQSDVWSFGVLIWEIVTLGGTPYPGIETPELLSLLKEGYRMGQPPQCDTPLYQIMLSCWNECPFRRPTFSDLCRSLRTMVDDKQSYVYPNKHDNFEYASIDYDMEEE